jgi:hypothetical protein
MRGPDRRELPSADVSYQVSWTLGRLARRLSWRSRRRSTGRGRRRSRLTPPFNPSKLVDEIAAVLRSYDVAEVVVIVTREKRGSSPPLRHRVPGPARPFAPLSRAPTARERTDGGTPPRSGASAGASWARAPARLRGTRSRRPPPRRARRSSERGGGCRPAVGMLVGGLARRDPLHLNR